MTRLADITMAVDLEAVDPALAQLVAAAAAHLSATKLIGFELSVIEALTNLVRHGGTRPEGALAEVRIESDGREIRVIIRDATGQPVDAALYDTPPDPDPDPLAEGGRGLHIMHSCSDRLIFRREDGANVLTLAYRIGEPD